ASANSRRQSLLPAYAPDLRAVTGVPADSQTAASLSTAQRVHLVGIGGSGMSALADLLAAQGKQVSGSDLSAQAVCRLTGRGIRAAVGTAPSKSATLSWSSSPLRPPLTTRRSSKPDVAACPSSPTPR